MNIWYHIIMEIINLKTVSPETRKIIKKQVISLIKKEENNLKLQIQSAFPHRRLKEYPVHTRRRALHASRRKNAGASLAKNAN